MIFDLAVPLAVERVRAGTPQPDRFEREQSEFFERVRQAYLRIALENPRRVRLIDAARSPEEINKELEQIVATLC